MAGAVRTPSPGAVASACFSLLGELPGDFLPIESNFRVQPAHVALLFRIDLVIPNTHHLMIASEGFDREITEPLSCRDKGIALLAFHILPLPSFWFCRFHVFCPRGYLDLTATCVEQYPSPRHQPHWRRWRWWRA